MHVEEQRYTPVSSGCVINPGGFPWSTPNQTDPPWYEQWDTDDHRFVFHLDNEDIGMTGTYIKRACTEFSNYERSWFPASNDGETLNLYAANGFGTDKPARIIDIDMNTLNPQQPYNAVFVPNWGPAARWWKWGHGSADGVNKILKGEAYGDWPADGKKKKLVSIARRPSSGAASFVFVINEFKRGDHDVHFRYNMKADWIVPFLKGEPWGDHAGDGIKRRLISAKRYAPGSWTILYRADPENARGHFFYGHPWDEISKHCHDYNQRVIYLERYSDSPDHYTAVLLKNT